MDSRPARPARAFPTTQVSLVELAAKPEAEGYRDAWERFCRGYWTPLHAFLVRTGSSPDEALDVLQDFFADGLEGKILQGFDPQRGRLRTYLLACLKNVRRKRLRSELARPDQRTFSFLDEEPGVPEPSADDPELAFEKEWAQLLHDRTLESVRERLKTTGDGPGLLLLDRWVLAPRRPGADELATELGLTTANLYTRATRLRHALVKEAEHQARTYATTPDELKLERDEALRLLRAGAAS